MCRIIFCRRFFGTKVYLCTQIHYANINQIRKNAIEGTVKYAPVDFRRQKWNVLRRKSCPALSSSDMFVSSWEAHRHICWVPSATFLTSTRICNRISSLFKVWRRLTLSDFGLNFEQQREKMGIDRKCVSKLARDKSPGIVPQLKKFENELWKTILYAVH